MCRLGLCNRVGLLIFVEGDGCLGAVRICIGFERYVPLTLDGSCTTDFTVAVEV